MFINNKNKHLLSIEYDKFPTNPVENSLIKYHTWVLFDNPISDKIYYSPSQMWHHIVNKYANFEQDIDDFVNGTCSDLFTFFAKINVIVYPIIKRNSQYLIMDKIEYQERYLESDVIGYAEIPVSKALSCTQQDKFSPETLNQIELKMKSELKHYTDYRSDAVFAITLMTNDEIKIESVSDVYDISLISQPKDLQQAGVFNHFPTEDANPNDFRRAKTKTVWY